MNGDTYNYIAPQHFNLAGDQTACTLCVSNINFNSAEEFWGKGELTCSKVIFLPLSQAIAK